MGNYFRQDIGFVDAPIHLIVTSGWALFKEGSYGSLFGAAVATKDEMWTEISQLTFSGADIIKVVASAMVRLKVPGTQ